MSQDNIPARVASIEKLIIRVSAAEKSQQKEIRMSIHEAREMITDLALISTKLGKTVQDIHQALLEIKSNSQNVDVKFDGGSF
jgi:urease gamma subunit